MYIKHIIRVFGNAMIVELNVQFKNSSNRKKIEKRVNCAKIFLFIIMKSIR